MLGKLRASEAARVALTHEIVSLSVSNPDSSFDALTDMAAALCKTPMALVSLVEETRQVFTARHGVDLTETSREVSFCSRAIDACENDSVFEVSDTHHDPRFRDNDLVTGDPNLRFYAGVPLQPLGTHAVGTLCVLGTEPAALTDQQRKDLIRLANIAEQLMRLQLLTTAKRSLLDRLHASELELAQMQARRSKAVRNISHELATPLAAIRMTTESLLQQPSGTPTSAHLEHLLSYALDAESLVQHLRVVNSSEEDALRLSPSAQPLAPLIEQYTTELFGPLDSSRINLELDDVAAVVDENAVGRIVVNLLTNAVGHNPPGTHVSVRLSSTDEGAVLQVADTGGGIPENDRLRMLQPYEANNDTGPGLGLAVIDALVNAHGGSVVIDANEPTGTVVSVTLPA